VVGEGQYLLQHKPGMYSIITYNIILYSSILGLTSGG